MAEDVRPESGGRDMLAKARELQTFLVGKGIPAKLIGGIAISLRCPGMPLLGLARDYRDIDLCAHARDATGIEAAMATLGFEPHQHFNAANYSRQQMFTNTLSGTHVDVFLDVLRMCQDLKLLDRLAIDDHCSLAVSDLALSKLQIVEITDKDKTDLLAIFLEHEPTPDSEVGLNTTRIADVCRASWGWWKSTLVSLDACRAYAPVCLAAADQQRACARIDTLQGAIEAAPKTVRWKARARIGTRSRWYELPEAGQLA